MVIINLEIFNLKIFKKIFAFNLQKNKFKIIYFLMKKSIFFMRDKLAIKEIEKIHTI